MPKRRYGPLSKALLSWINPDIQWHIAAKTFLMKLSAVLFSILLFTGAAITAHAQLPPVTKVVKFKPPAVQTFLGINTNGAAVTKEEAAQLIALPLKITDAAKNMYIIDSYQFLYKRKSTIQDEETGRKQNTFTTVADRFKVTPLPKIWVDNLNGGFQKGEELYFFDIFVKDNAGRLFSAPELKITIQ
ncbi:MAG: hypothetical protein ABI416_18680 [Ginsengibacter sp.]